MISCLVFSRDRAMQLDALLRSIRLYAPSLYGEIVVLYRATASRFQVGYDFVAAEQPAPPPAVYLLPERDFHADVLAWVNGETSGRLAFHCDDDVFYRSPPPLPDVPVFSLRLGRNCTYCHPLDLPQAVPPWRFRFDSPTISWPVASAVMDFAYPTSLDGHIYDAAILRRVIGGLDFDRPNSLEHALTYHAAEFGAELHSPAHSCVVSIPANRVNEGYPNPASDNPDWSVEALNERYLAGYRLDLAAMDFSAVRACHQEIPLAFERR